MDTRTTDDGIPEALRSAYEVNLPPASFTVEDAVLGGRLRRRRRMAGKVAGVVVAAAVVPGTVVASSGAGAGRTLVTPAAAPSVRTTLAAPGRSQVSARTGRPSAATSLPHGGASAGLVIEAYLRALVAGDCVTAHALVASTFNRGNGELCGDVKVSSFTLNREPAAPRPDEVIYSCVLVTNGSSDGSIPPGRLTWFYDLKHRDGSWKLVSGGSGP